MKDPEMFQESRLYTTSGLPDVGIMVFSLLFDVHEGFNECESTRPERRAGALIVGTGGALEPE